jgi:CheY-like chemotaxis protein
MSVKSNRTETFAYILIVESDKDLRESALNTITVPNCAVDTVRDEDEAVYKALQHRPQLIIVKRHEPLNINVWNPPQPSAASLICRRAHLTTAVRLVTHSDVAVTAQLALNPVHKLPSMTPILQQRIAHLALDRRLFSNPQQPILLRPKFVGQDWRKEWYLYCSRDQTTEFLSHHIQFLLGRGSRAPPPPQQVHAIPACSRKLGGLNLLQRMFRKEVFPHNYFLVELDIAVRIGYFVSLRQGGAGFYFFFEPLVVCVPYRL